MYLKELMIGKTLDIYILRQGYKYRVVSKIEGIDKNMVCVTLIASRNRVFRFLDTDQVEILYKHNKSLYKWNEVKAGITELDGSQVHYFISDRKGSIFNRRNAYRVECDIALILHYYVLNKALTEDKIEDDSFSFLYDDRSSPLYNEMVCKCLIKDLSETGVGIYANEGFEKDDEIVFTLSTSYGELHCKAKVVRITKAYHANFYHYYGCVLIESSKELPRYLFELQRKLIHTKR